MAIIYSYPKVTTPLATDVLVLTDTTLVKGGKRKNQTKSLALSDLASYVVSSTSGITGGGTLNKIPLWTPDGLKLGDSIITQAASGQGVTVTGGLDVTEDLNVTGSTELFGSLTVEGVATFNDEVECNNNVTVQGVFAADGNSVFSGGVTINEQLIDGDGSVGTAGQVLSSTGTQTEWISVAGGSVTGTGTTNNLPLWSDGPNGVLGNSIMSQATSATQNAKRITVDGRMDITGNGGDVNGSTVSLTASSARLGIATGAYPGSITEPEASLDVGKNARIRGSLNVGSTNEQYLFVSTTGDTPVGYVKMGYYGTGVDYNLSGGPQSSAQYTTAFNDGGKICEDERIMTFKLSREVMAGLPQGGKELIAQDSNFTYIVKEAYIYSVTTSGGTSPLISTGQDLEITYQTQNNGIRTTQAWTVNSTEFNSDPDKRKLMAFKESIDWVAVGTQFAVPKSSVRIFVSGVNSAGTGICDFFLRMRVKNIDFNDDIENNTQLITIT